jgi:hypothetical protein
MGAKSSSSGQILRPIQWETAPATPLPEVYELFGREAELAWKTAHRAQRQPDASAWAPTAAGELYDPA